MTEKQDTNTSQSLPACSSSAAASRPSASSIMPQDPPLHAVIFDRDGVLIRDCHFPIKAADIQWTPGAWQLLRLLNTHGVKALVASNQSGIARGLFGPDDVDAFHAEMQRQLAEQGLWLEGIEYCPHHPEAGGGPWTRDCECRKPKPGMLLKLMQDHGVRPENTAMIGDRDVDLGAAARAGVEGLLFRGGDLLQAVHEAGWLARLEQDTVRVGSPAARWEAGTS